MVNLWINDKKTAVPEGTTILEAAKSVGIRIPTLCFLKDINEIGACRVCVVEVEGVDRCVTACNSVVEEGMRVHTHSRRVRMVRKTNVKLILSQHNFQCATCIRSGNCSLQSLANELNITDMPYASIFEDMPTDKSFPIVKESSKCIKCMRCIQICDKVQGMNIWDLTDTGARTTVNVSRGEKLAESDCTLCGQCVVNCPVGALRERDDVGKVLDAVENPELTTIVQIAPAVRTGWGEELGLDRERATEKRLVGCLRKIGFDYIFDTNFSADLTIMEEGSEFLQRLPEIRDKKLPMFTSCCPGWVSFMKTEYPQYLSRLSSAKSPQQMFGAIAKTYYAELLGIEPEKLFVVSVMPCISKKREITLEGMDSAGTKQDVDAVLTTREAVRLLKAYYINPEAVDEDEFDKPLGVHSGAGVIFGATGGVMEAALRTAYNLVTGKNPDADAFKYVRGPEGIKEAVVDIAGTKVKVAVVSGLGNARKLMKKIDRHTVDYDFVEVMACPGGCINGGGQPIHDGGADVEARTAVLYGLDRANPIRFSHENPEIIECYKNFLDKPLSDKAHELLHVEYR
ncbi:MAG: [FeFe] hydrogenase, group A [Lachnospiraceae bacterium]|nr:[FeFe] hydrogenase, group A [Lachnospiraceae bacterium]